VRVPVRLFVNDAGLVYAPNTSTEVSLGRTSLSIYVATLLQITDRVSHPPNEKIPEAYSLLYPNLGNFEPVANNNKNKEIGPKVTYDIIAYMPYPLSASITLNAVFSIFETKRIVPIFLNLRARYSSALAILTKLLNNRVIDIIRRGFVKKSSATRFAIHGAKKKRSNVKMMPKTRLIVKAVETKLLSASFFWIIAEPRPASAMELTITMTPVNAAKYPKSALDKRRDIIAKYNTPSIPLAIVKIDVTDIPFKNVSVLLEIAI